MTKYQASCLAEFFGTAALVFFAAGAVMASSVIAGLPTPLIAGACSGIVLMIVIWTFGDISGAHVNPAFTLVLAITHRFPWRLVPGYVGAQLLGSAAGAALLFLIVGRVGAMGANLPNTQLGVSGPAAFATEVWLSFLMMLVIEGAVAAPGRLKDFAAIPIGGIVGLEVMIMGPIAGAAMNPARAFGPYVFDGQWQYFWIYVAGPVTGILAAALVMRALSRRTG
ncbi:MAG: aquaporin [Alphaproteobacteria bacterium]|nr:aquaporin [Alphaproteobacteria bacterium]